MYEAVSKTDSDHPRIRRTERGWINECLLSGMEGIQASMRRNLLPESLVDFFGNVTQLQLLILAILLGYLLVCSQVF